MAKIKAKILEEKSRTLHVQDFNFRASVLNNLLCVEYKKWTVSYRNLFDIGIDELDQLIEILSAVKEKLPDLKQPHPTEE